MTTFRITTQGAQRVTTVADFRIVTEDTLANSYGNRGYRGLDPSPKAAPRPVSDTVEHLSRYANDTRVVTNNLLRGKLNSTLPVTLTPSATSTAITSPLLGGQTYIQAMPLSANAASIQGSIWISGQGDGVATINHSSLAAGDLDFLLLLIG